MTKRKIKPALEKRETPNPAQLAQGGYVEEFVMHVETQTKAKAYRACHDPVIRWQRAGKLSQTQLGAITWCQWLWRVAGLSQRVTANYGERIPGHLEGQAANEIDARNRLGEIQKSIPKTYWQVFEHVCRHSEPVEIAGLRLHASPRAAADKAHTCVCFVADLIAMRM